MRATVVAVIAAGMLTAPVAVQAQAQAPAPDMPQCPRDAQPLPRELGAWSKPRPLTAAPAGPGPAIAIGQAYAVTLRPDAELKLPNLPGPVADRVGSGGVASFTVKAAGSYQVALGSGVWVDVVRDGKALESIAHGHGPACSGIAKIVRFTLTPGRYWLTLDGSERDRTALLIAPAR